MLLGKECRVVQFGLRWWMLLSNVNGWPRVGHLCLIGYIGYGIFGRRTSERMRAIRAMDRQAVSRRVSRHVSRHVCRSRSPVCVLCCVCFGWGCFVLVLFLRGVVVDFFLT